MFELNLQHKPKRNDSRFLHEHELDGGVKIISAKYPEVGNIVINRVGKYILDRCDGINTIDDIIKNVVKNHKGCSFDTVKKDVTKLLFRFYKVGIIDYEVEPYFDVYNKQNDSYSFSILSEDQILDVINAFSGDSEFDYDSKYVKAYGLNANRIRQAVFLGLEQYACIYDFNGNAKLLLHLEASPDFRTSLSVFFHYIDSSLKNAEKSVIDFLMWSQVVFSYVLERRFLRINSCSTKEKTKAICYQLGFEYLGVIENCATENNELLSSHVYSLKL